MSFYMFLDLLHPNLAYIFRFETSEARYADFYHENVKFFKQCFFSLKHIFRRNWHPFFGPKHYIFHPYYTGCQIRIQQVKKHTKMTFLEKSNFWKIRWKDATGPYVLNSLKKFHGEFCDDYFLSILPQVFKSKKITLRSCSMQK